MTQARSVATFVYNLRYPGQYYDSETGLNYNDFRDYDTSTGRYAESDPIGLSGGINTFSYVSANPVGMVDPFGLDWIEYTGQRLTLYGGNPGDRSQARRTCAATSGGPNNQAPLDQNVPEVGPVPAGTYSVNLVPDPARIARADAITGEILSNPVGGIERLPDSHTTRDGRSYTYPGWGTWRMRLDPKRGNTYRRHNFYLHNSHKGYTHGCVETCGDLLDDVLTYRANGNSAIDVLIRYTTTSTNGGTRR